MILNVEVFLFPLPLFLLVFGFVQLVIGLSLLVFLFVLITDDGQLVLLKNQSLCYLDSVLSLGFSFQGLLVPHPHLGLHPAESHCEDEAVQRSAINHLCERASGSGMSVTSLIMKIF